MCVIKYLLSQATRVLLAIPPMNLFVGNDHDRLNCKASIQVRVSANMGSSVSSTARRIIMPGAKEFVESAIAADTVVIFSKTYCPFCKMAKEVFDKLNQTYKTIELDERKDGDEIQDVLLEMTGARSVPRVFIKGECIGGGTDCKKMFENGELQKKL